MIPRWAKQDEVANFRPFLMSRTRFTTPLGGLALAILLGGCAVFFPSNQPGRRGQPHQPPPKPKLPTPVPEPPRKQSYWQPETAQGDPQIVINLTEQRAHFFKGKTEVGQSLISTGKRGHETATGEFAVVQLDKNHASNLYGEFVNSSSDVVQRNVDTKKHKAPAGARFRGAKMPFFLRFNGGIGMHAGRLPGYPASHGCVRLPRFMAEHFFNNAPIGTPVIVKGSARTRSIDAEPDRSSAKRGPKKESEPTPDKPQETPVGTPAETPPPAPATEAPEPAAPASEKQPEPPAPAPIPAGA